MYVLSFCSTDRLSTSKQSSPSTASSSTHDGGGSGNDSANAAITSEKQVQFGIPTHLKPMETVQWSIFVAHGWTNYEPVAANVWLIYIKLSLLEHIFDSHSLQTPSNTTMSGSTSDSSFFDIHEKLRELYVYLYLKDIQDTQVDNRVSIAFGIQFTTSIYIAVKERFTREPETILHSLGSRVSFYTIHEFDSEMIFFTQSKPYT